MDTDIQSVARALARVSQHQRLIELDTALPDALVVERFQGTESVCDDFSFTVDCLSTDAYLDARALLGQPMALHLRLANGGLRHWHGHCTRVMPLGSDGGLVRYRLMMEPWIAFLKLRRNALVFQDLDALGVLERVLDDYPQASLRVDATQPLPVYPITTQYRESDHAFVFRLLADAGLAWRYEHAQDNEGGVTLVVFDRDASVPEAIEPTLRFHRSDATEASDAIQRFSEQRQTTASVLSAASWQAEQVEAVAASASGSPAGPNAPVLEAYRVPRSGRFANRADADQHAALQLDALRLPQRLHAGAGSARSMAAGFAFTLTQHPDLSGQAFLPLVIEHRAANNLDSGIVALLDPAGGIERGNYRNRFLAVTADTPVVPVARYKPTAPGMQTATVVGLPESAVTSTRDHQVRIQFPWQRGAAPNPGGLTDAGSRAHPNGHAPGDDTSGTWVRVAEWVAGPNWGSHALPRVGSEVLVEFLHGDIDQPVITGQLYNGKIAPPFALADASNHPGTLSGLHAQSLDGGGTQQWVIDDAPGQLRQRLHTSLADSRLELGYLIHHDNARRSGVRGSGFDLATLGWANLRAGQGMLLSTTARQEGASTQMDVTEAVAQLKGAQRSAQALDDAVAGAQVAPLSANERQTEMLAHVDPEQDGRYNGAVNGQSATKPSGGGRDSGADAHARASAAGAGSAVAAPVERLATPLLFIESPDAIALATPKSALAHAGGNLHLTSQHDTQISAGQTVAGVAGGQVALFAQRGPIKAIAADGPVSLQAHTGKLEVLADQSVTITASDERIDVLAKDRIVLQAGQTTVTLEGGDITFACPGEFRVKAGQVPFEGGASGDIRLSLPDGLLKLKPDRMPDFSG
ncbi:type VI secretion system tip protein VgrG [Lysobacter sp. H21R4]|uniref:type VI secretion system Vgr family protein n=1 Tax=Lysobacter sp. H21R4 TaxID=2781021 RepID=UPI0018897E1B|nr:type VI secretion system Vgr family protein [Lysobacter sp. H21R4]QOY62256.1 type VI secretion system tip protein VgrG [Lysobacter sp. H21R4]